ncbi:MAG: hypothetical protein IIY93_09760 [Clostridia bacterium]|nr:hypothetical protein [Clostridia bacterium]
MSERNFSHGNPAGKGRQFRPRNAARTTDSAGWADDFESDDGFSDFPAAKDVPDAADSLPTDGQPGSTHRGRRFQQASRKKTASPPAADIPPPAREAPEMLPSNPSDEPQLPSPSELPDAEMLPIVTSTSSPEENGEAAFASLDDSVFSPSATEIPTATETSAAPDFPSHLLADWDNDLPTTDGIGNALDDDTFLSPFSPSQALPAEPSPDISPDEAPVRPVDEASPAAQKNSQRYTLAMVAVGTLFLVCLFFFLHSLLHHEDTTEEVPSVSGAKQVSASDTAVLLSWDGSSSADGYRLYYTDGDGVAIVSDCDLPFAALRHLKPNASYEVDIFALRDGKEYQSQHLTCTTQSYCEVREILVSKVGSDFISLNWNFEGADEGFEVIAYVLDENGQRYLTSKKIQIAAGKNKCKIKNLTPELRYTVAVMPLTPYGKMNQLTFTTGKHSEKYNDIDIIRFVICPADSENIPNVHTLKQLQPDTAYKTSLILNGKTNKKHTVNLSLVVTDADDNVITCSTYPDIHTNPENKQWFIHRSFLFDFRSPQKPGDYTMYLVLDGQYGMKIKFFVEK